MTISGEIEAQIELDPNFRSGALGVIFTRSSGHFQVV